MKTTIGQLAQRGIGLDPVEELEAAHVGKPQVEDAAVEWPVEHLLQGLGPGGGGVDLDVAVGQELDDALALDLVVLDDQEALDVRLDELADLLEALLQPLHRRSA